MNRIEKIIEFFGRQKMIVYLGLAILLFFLTLFKLNAVGIHNWDESLFANRALHWAAHGEYFTNWETLEFCKMDHPNTKPPLVSLIQAGMYKLFSYERWALRLPIVLFGLACALGWVRVFKKDLSMPLIGWTSVFILLINKAINERHLMGWSGDHDIPLAFFLFASLIFYWRYWNFEQNKGRNLLLFFAFTGMAVLTKSITGLFFLPGVFLYTIFFRPWLSLLKDKFFYIGLCLFLVLLSSFYGLMELKEEGFLQLVWDNEIGGRYNKSIDDHLQPFDFYGKYLIKYFMPWLCFVPVGIWYGWRSDNVALKSITRLTTFCAVCLFFVLSAAETKLYWYLASLYPLLSMLSALGVVFIIKALVERVSFLKGTKVINGLIVAIFLSPFIIKAIDRKSSISNIEPTEKIELALDKFRKEIPEYTKIRIHSRNVYYPTLVYLANKYQHVYGYEIELVTSYDELFKGDVIVGEYHACMSNLELEKHGEYKGIKMYEVVSVRPKEE